MKHPLNKALWLSGALTLMLPASGMADLNMFARTTGDTCFSCHGPNGKGVPGGSIPPIAGKDASYLAKTMKAFRDGKRPSTIMQRHAKGYTDAEIETIAQYLSQIK